ncbi:MAG: hypothetical protein JO354_00130 [Verrucomicrobia bacterium]|nr:hypothetical protein [Verrucomicrobiota bacterium]
MEPVAVRRRLRSRRIHRHESRRDNPQPLSPAGALPENRKLLSPTPNGGKRVIYMRDADGTTIDLMTVPPAA